MQELLFEPLKTERLVFPNRLMLLPLFTAYGQRGGRISRAMIEHYREMAAGGAGTVVVECTLVSSEGMPETRMVSLDRENVEEELSRLADAVKQEGAAVGCQINHPGRFAAAAKPAAPSAVPAVFDLSLKMRLALFIRKKFSSSAVSTVLESPVPRSMTLEDIQKMTAAYAGAAKKIQQAGFDFVELHGATGYLLSQFLSPRTNKRGDAYGGNLKNRARFPLEVVAAVREAVEPDFPVGYRFLADEWLSDGLSLEEARSFAVMLERSEAAYLSVTAGTYESLIKPECMALAEQEGYMVDLAGAIKQEVSIPVVAAGRIARPTLAGEILAAEKADLIGLGRVLFADPLWPEKARTAREEEIIHCRPGCNTCFIMVMQDKPAFCPQWPAERKKKRREWLG